MLNTFFIFPQQDTTARTGRYGHHTGNMAAKLRRGTRLRAAQLLGREVGRNENPLPARLPHVRLPGRIGGKRLRIRLAGRKLCRGPIRPSRPAGTRYRTPPAAMGRSAISDAGTERIRRKQTGRTLLPPGRFRNPTGTDRCEYRPQRAAFTASKQAILNHPMSNPRVTYRFTAMPVLQLRPQKTRRDASKR